MLPRTSWILRLARSRERDPLARGTCRAASEPRRLLRLCLMGLALAISIAPASGQRIVVLGEEETTPPDTEAVEKATEEEGEREGERDRGKQEDEVRITVHPRGGITISGDRMEDDDRFTQHSSDDVVSVGGKVVVPENLMVHGDAVCVMGTVHVDGMVRGDAVAVGGDIDVGPRGIVRGEAVCIGGRIHESPGAQIGERVQIGFLPHFGASRCFLAGGWITFLLHLLFIGLAGWILLRISTGGWLAVIATLKARAGGSFLAGLGAGIVYWILIIPLLVILIVVLAMTVIGIPLVPVVLLAAFLLPAPGYAVTCALLGGVIQGTSEQAQRGGPTGWVNGAYLLGHLLLSSPWLIAALLWSITHGWGGVAGVLLAIAWGVVVLAVAFGWGAILLSRFGRRFPGETVFAAPVSPAMPAAPPPVAPTGS